MVFIIWLALHTIPQSRQNSGGCAMDGKLLGRGMTEVEDLAGEISGIGSIFLTCGFAYDAGSAPLLCVYFLSLPSDTANIHSFRSKYARQVLSPDLSTLCPSQIRKVTSAFTIPRGVANKREREGGLARCYGARVEGPLSTTTNTPRPAHQHITDSPTAYRMPQHQH